MTNEEIKQMLRELSDSADAEGRVKSKTLRISVEQEEVRVPKKKKRPAPEDVPETPQMSEPLPETAETEEAVGPESEESETDEAASGRLSEVLDGAKKGLGAAAGVFGKVTGLIGDLRKKSAARKMADDEEEVSSSEDAPSSEDVPSLEDASSLEDDLSEEDYLDDEEPEEQDDPIKEESKAQEEESAAEQTEESAEAQTEEPAETQSEEPAENAAKERVPREERVTPIEPEDFESDADDFRSAPSEEEEPEERGSFRDRIKASLTMLEGKGIGRKERLMILAGVVLTILIVVITMSVLSNRRKTANVTTEDGLTVTVENEPASWTNNGKVTLGIRTGSPIQSITVNGENVSFTGSNRTEVEVDAKSEQLEIMVVTEEKVMNASAQIQKIDVQAPEVMLSSNGTEATIEAVDTRSGVAAVYCGVIKGLSDVPEYALYTGPITVEEGALYAYYAVDQAGNMAGPVMTDMTPAESIVLGTEKLSLFPGDTYLLSMTTEPQDAFVNGMHVEVSDPSIISIDSTGLVTALANGEADITVSGDGLAPAVCHVTVRTSAELTISAVGDITLGDDVNFSPLNSFSTVATMNGMDYFFANVKDIFAADDLTFGNFEGTLTTGGTRADKTFAFRGDPSYTQILTSGSVEAVTLANNHSSDYGEESLTDTKKYLTEANIDYCMGDEVVVKEVAGVTVGLVGIYCLNDTESTLLKQTAEAIETARKAGAQVIVTAFHWGTESSDTPDDMQQKLAHAAIDDGADLVVGHHPHVLQGIEVYEGKYIVYSLGNFCFGGNSNPSDMDTMIFQETFHIAKTGDITTTINVIPCRLSSDSTWNNYQPTPASGEEAQRIMDKINARSAMFGTETLTYQG